MGVLPKEMMEGGAPRRPGGPGPRPPAPRPPSDEPPSPALKLFKAKKGFANYYFNEEAQKKLVAAFARQGDFTTLKGTWTIEGELDRKGTKTACKIELSEIPGDEGQGPKAIVKLNLGGLDYTVEPLKQNPDLRDLKDPPGSGGLLMALYHYHRLLTLGSKGFEGGFSHGGHEPFYPRWADGSDPHSAIAARTDAQVLQTEHAAVRGQWFYTLDDARLLGFDVTLTKDEDPCEVYLSDYKPIDGRSLPHRIDVRYGNDIYGSITVKRYELK
jgi:hypothetical protein